jgi:hypothetical protein
VHAGYGWWQVPTTHFMVTHAILDAKADATAYRTLQEEVEHTNLEIKNKECVTFVAKETEYISESSCMHIINNYFAYY